MYACALAPHCCINRWHVRLLLLAGGSGHWEFCWESKWSGAGSGSAVRETVRTHTPQCVCNVRACASAQSLLKEFLSSLPLVLLPSLQPGLQQPGWSPSLSTLASCCLAANNRRCLQSNLPLPWPMGAGALFHQTSLFRICREASSSKCYHYGIEVRPDTDASERRATSRTAAAPLRRVFTNSLDEWRLKDLYGFRRIMLGWSFETCAAPWKTRIPKWSPEVLDEPHFLHVGLLSLLLNSHRFCVASCYPSLDYGLGSRGPRGWRLWRFTPELYALPAACEPRPPPETQLLPRCFRT